jgi:hypothetical protein
MEPLSVSQQLLRTLSQAVSPTERLRLWLSSLPGERKTAA